jgi:hypothetical protein
LSPNDKYAVVVFLGDQGTLSSYLPKVSIYGKNDKIRYGDKKAEVFVGYRAKYVDAIWKDDTTLLIKHNCLEEYIFKQLDTFADISIEYVIATRETINFNDIKDFEFGEYVKKRYYPE